MCYFLFFFFFKCIPGARWTPWQATDVIDIIIALLGTILCLPETFTISCKAENTQVTAAFGGKHVDAHTLSYSGCVVVTVHTAVQLKVSLEAAVCESLAFQEV